jgi:hypothetical protein
MTLDEYIEKEYIRLRAPHGLWRGKTGRMGAADWDAHVEEIKRKWQDYDDPTFVKDADHS